VNSAANAPNKETNVYENLIPENKSKSDKKRLTINTKRLTNPVKTCLLKDLHSDLKFSYPKTVKASKHQ